MKPRLLLALLLFCCQLLMAQQNPAVVDSMKRELDKTKAPSDRIDLLGKLCMVLMNTSIPEADRYGLMMTREAEISRKRPLMVKAAYFNGIRYSFFRQNKQYVQKAIDYFNQGIAIARQNELDKELAEGYLHLSTVYQQVPDLEKALSYTTQAFALSQVVGYDSLMAATQLSYGNVYQAKKERLLALRYYLNALKIAEEKKLPSLLRSSYSNLTSFYADIKEYDKAIDYAKAALDELPTVKSGNERYQKVVDLIGIGNLYVAKKNFEMSVYYFEESLKLADSLHYAPLKMPAYNGLLMQYIEAKQPQKALEFFNTHTDLRQFITNFGFAHAIDDAYGVIHTQLGNYDSAAFYFARAEPRYAHQGTPGIRLNFYNHVGTYYQKSGRPEKAVEYFLRAKNIADSISNLEWQQNLSKSLDTAFAQAGDFRQSRHYGGLYAIYRDSLQKLGEQKDLLQMELADEQQRTERKRREDEEALREKHNIQYMGITIAIALVFLLLVLMGAFRVSVSTIKIMGFFAFIFLFEFIILIADNKIHHWTHGEPLPILGIKIVLIAMLLPLHHWLEHKVVHYLSSRRLIIPSTKGLLSNIIKRKAVKP